MANKLATSHACNFYGIETRFHLFAMRVEKYREKGLRFALLKIHQHSAAEPEMATLLRYKNKI